MQERGANATFEDQELVGGARNRVCLLLGDVALHDLDAYVRLPGILPSQDKLVQDRPVKCLGQARSLNARVKVRHRQ